MSTWNSVRILSANSLRFCLTLLEGVLSFKFHSNLLFVRTSDDDDNNSGENYFRRISSISNAYLNA
jgi:hypothetical protein